MNQMLSKEFRKDFKHIELCFIMVSWDIESQTKGILSVVITIIIAVSVAFLKENLWLWIVILVLGVIQVILVCIPSREERFYKERMCYMENQDRQDRKFNEKSKKFKLSKKLQKMEKEADRMEKPDINKLLINFNKDFFNRRHKIK